MRSTINNTNRIRKFNYYNKAIESESIKMVTNSQIGGTARGNARAKIPLRRRNFNLVNGYHRVRNSTSLS